MTSLRLTPSIIQLPPLTGGNSRPNEADISPHDRRNVSAGFEPVSIEDGHVQAWSPSEPHRHPQSSSWALDTGFTSHGTSFCINRLNSRRVASVRQ